MSSQNYDIPSYIFGARSSVNFNKFTLGGAATHAYTPENNFDLKAHFSGSDSQANIRGISLAKHSTELRAFGEYSFGDLSWILGGAYTIEHKKSEQNAYSVNLGLNYKFDTIR